MSIYIISDGVPEPDPEQFTVSLSTDNVLVSIEEETAVVVIFEGTYFEAQYIWSTLLIPRDFLCVPGRAQPRNALTAARNALTDSLGIRAGLLCMHDL